MWPSSISNLLLIICEGVDLSGWMLITFQSTLVSNAITIAAIAVLAVTYEANSIVPRRLSVSQRCSKCTVDGSGVTSGTLSLIHPHRRTPPGHG